MSEKYYYSASRNVFYLESMRADYKNWPDDEQEITFDVYKQYNATPPDGKMRET